MQCAQNIYNRMIVETSNSTNLMQLYSTQKKICSFYQIECFYQKQRVEGHLPYQIGQVSGHRLLYLETNEMNTS